MRSAETELQKLRATASEIAAPKTGWSRRHSDKKTILKHFLRIVLKGKLLASKLRKSADKSLSQPGCSHSNTIYEIQLQKTISITYAAAAHELQITIEHNRTMRNDVGNYSSKTGISTPKRKKDDFEALL